MCEDTCDTAALVISELVTNAIVHTASAVVVCELSDGEEFVRLSVRDEGCAPGEPHPSPQRPEEEHGRGLLLVEALCHSWGAQEHGLGLLVWAELMRDAEPPGESAEVVADLALDLVQPPATAPGPDRSEPHHGSEPRGDLGWGARPEPDRSDDTGEDDEPAEQTCHAPAVLAAVSGTAPAADDRAIRPAPHHADTDTARDHAIRPPAPRSPEAGPRIGRPAHPAPHVGGPTPYPAPQRHHDSPEVRPHAGQAQQAPRQDTVTPQPPTPERHGPDHRALGHHTPRHHTPPVHGLEHHGPEPHGPENHTPALLTRSPSAPAPAKPVPAPAPVAKASRLATGAGVLGPVEGVRERGRA